jgi:hypothetical protein
VPVRRCPACGIVNRPTVAACECGFVFDALQAQAMGIARRTEVDDESLSDQRHYHMHRLTIGWLSIGAGVLLLAAAIALIAFKSRLLLAPGAGCAIAFGKGVHLVRASRRSLRLLDGRDAGLPRARLLK